MSNKQLSNHFDHQYLEQIIDDILKANSRMGISQLNNILETCFKKNDSTSPVSYDPIMIAVNIPNIGVTSQVEIPLITAIPVTMLSVDKADIVLNAENETNDTAKPTDEVIPKTNPIKEVSELLPTAIIPIPTVAIIIDIQTFKEIFSFKNKKANNAVKNGIAAKHNKVIAALVLVIENIKEIIATPKPDPPIKPDKPILK